MIIWGFNKQIEVRSEEKKPINGPKQDDWEKQTQFFSKSGLRREWECLSER